MPWKTCDLLQQREEFVKRATSAELPFSGLCRMFGVSRPTGYKWLFRYRHAEGDGEALKDVSRRTHNSPFRVGSDVAEKIRQLRAEQACGAKKLSDSLRQEGIAVGHSTVQKVLTAQGAIVKEDPSAASWIRQVFVAADPLSKIEIDLPNVGTPAGFAKHLHYGLLPDRKKAMAVLARLKGIRLHTIAECLNLAPGTILRYEGAFATGGLDALFRERKSKVNDDEHRGPLFALLHSPPSAYGINRTTWRMEDLQRVLKEKGHRLSEQRIRRIIKAGGYRWRRAKIVLTSNDPESKPSWERLRAYCRN